MADVVFYSVDFKDTMGWCVCCGAPAAEIEEFMAGRWLVGWIESIGGRFLSSGRAKCPLLVADSFIRPFGVVRLITGALVLFPGFSGY